MKFSQLKLETPYLKLDPIFYDEVEPTPLDKPFVISASRESGKLLGIKEDLLEDELLLSVLNGECKLEGSKTFAMCYAGHQFGHFVPRLGDGRAINLGKVHGQNLQLKGSGQTLYSRHGDGRAVLRSSIREYLVSEAMHGLGIETSRALALIGSDTDVAREQWEKGAIVLRLSPTWIRFGTFEYFNSIGHHDKLQELADYVIDESFPHLKGEDELYVKMYKEIVHNTAKTIAKWQSVGFNHGVMNTDNMAIDGRTIDYGPFAFLDDYNPEYICNKTDREGRYSFRSQPGIAKWNLERLAVALSPIVDYDLTYDILDDDFDEVYETEYLTIMSQKIGLFNQDEDDPSLVRWMLSTFGRSPIDYTKFFRTLSHYDGNKNDILDLVDLKEPMQKWLEGYDLRLKKEDMSEKERHEMMLGVNPKYILKNHLLQEAIEMAKESDFSRIEELLKVAENPYDEHNELEHLSRSAPQREKNIKLSCSS